MKTASSDPTNESRRQVAASLNARRTLGPRDDACDARWWRMYCRDQHTQPSWAFCRDGMHSVLSILPSALKRNET